MNPPASRSPLGQPTQSRSTSHSPPDLPPAYDPRGAFPEAQLAQPAGLAKTWDEKGEEERDGKRKGKTKFMKVAKGLRKRVGYGVGKLKFKR